jgi:hypothetical protein
LVLLSVAVNILLILILYLIARKRIRRILDGGDAVDAIRDEINRLIVELNQTSDRNIGIIEERIGRLKRLVDEADRKITLLSKESEKVRIGYDVYDRLKKSKSLVKEGSEQNTEPESNAPKESAALSESVAALGTANKTGTTDGGNATAQVLELYRQGFEPKFIAAKTGSTLGEIELIISLAGGR